MDGGTHGSKQRLNQVLLLPIFVSPEDKLPCVFRLTGGAAQKEYDDGRERKADKIETD